MIDELNVDWVSLTKADMYTIIKQTEEQNVKLRELCEEMLLYIAYPYVCVRPSVLVERARELGIETDE